MACLWVWAHHVNIGRFRINATLWWGITLSSWSLRLLSCRVPGQCIRAQPFRSRSILVMIAIIMAPPAFFSQSHQHHHLIASPALYRNTGEIPASNDLTLLDVLWWRQWCCGGHMVWIFILDASVMPSVILVLWTILLSFLFFPSFLPLRPVDGVFGTKGLVFFPGKMLGGKMFAISSSPEKKKNYHLPLFDVLTSMTQLFQKWHDGLVLILCLSEEGRCNID